MSESSEGRKLVEEFMIENDIMTMDEVAELLHCRRSKMYQVARSQGIPFFRVGKTRLFLKSEVSAWIRNSIERSVPPAVTEAGND